MDQTNFDVPEIIYNILFNDSIYFEYVKNDKANISGFLNTLIPNLASYREDLHFEFLKFNNNDEKLTEVVEKNIYNIYLKTFDLSDDAKRNIQLRINKENKNKFIEIQDNYIKKYSMTYSMYIKTLLYEYVSRPLYQREILFVYNFKKDLLKALKESLYIYVCTKNNERVKILPVDISINPQNEHNFIFGYLTNKDFTVIELSYIKNILLTNEKEFLSNEDYEEIGNLEIDFFDKLNNQTEGVEQCLDHQNLKR